MRPFTTGDIESLLRRHRTIGVAEMMNFPGVIAGDDLVRREGVERWVPAADLPWIRGLREGNRADGQRLFRVTLLVMAAALGAVLWLQSRVAPKPKPSQPPATGGQVGGHQVLLGREELVEPGQGHPRPAVLHH